LPKVTLLFTDKQQASISIATINWSEKTNACALIRIKMKNNSSMKKSIKLFISIFLTGVSLSVFGQQDEMFTQFFTNKLAINPAYAGSKEAMSVLALYRNQWVSFDGSPKTISLTAHTPIFKNTSGVGFSLINDRIGIFNNLILNVAYTFRVDFPFGKLSLGLSGRLQRMQADWSKTNPFSMYDSEIPFTATNLFMPNFGAGAYFYNDWLYAGLSVPHLLNSKYRFEQQQTVVETQANAERHLYAMVGAIVRVTDEIKFKPALQFRYAPNSPNGLDLNGSFIFFDKFVLGASLRAGDSYSAVIQYWISKKLAMGYSHDFNFTRLADYHNGSHEIFLSWDLPLKGFGVENPRFF